MLRKSLFLVVILALVLVASLSAQTKSTGFIGGLNFANMSGDDIDDFEDSNYSDNEVNSKIGLHAGFYMNFPMSNAFSIRGEAALSMNGSKWESEGEDDDGYDSYDYSSSTSHSMIFLQVPVSGIYTFNIPSLTFKPYVGAGLSVGYPVYGHWKSEWEYDEESGDEDGDYTKKDFAELSAPVLGYQLNFGAEYNKYTFELRIEKSMTPVFDENDFEETFYSNAKLLFGYRFN